MHTAILHRPMHPFPTLFFRSTFTWTSMFHILNFVQSFGACFPSSARKTQTAIEATNEILAKQMVLPSPSSRSEAACKTTGEVVIEKYTTREEVGAIDIIEAEMKWGISALYYFGYEFKDGILRIMFSTRLRNRPKRLRVVSCPRLIDASRMTPNERDLLRIQLDAAWETIPWLKLESFACINRNDWFVVLWYA